MNRLAFPEEKLNINVDPEGNFRTSFKSYIPLDIWFDYRTNFQVLLQPGDSLYIRFDGRISRRADLLSTISFSGDRAETNRFAARFQQMFYTDPALMNSNEERAIKEYGPEQYVEYSDMLREKEKTLYDRFVAENNLDETSKRWAERYLDQDYYHRIGTYPYLHAYYNKGDRQLDTLTPELPAFSRILDQMPPIEPEDLIAAAHMNRLVNHYKSHIINKMITDRTEDETKWYILTNGGVAYTSGSYDSINIHNIMKYTPDPLLREILLTKHFDGNFQKQDIAAFEKYRDLVSENITQPFLAEPLYEKYLATKAHLEKPELHTEAIIKEASTTAAGQLFNEILEANKGKVIYVDFWATWCSPCLAEMPHSKKMEEELHGRNVVFVYIGVDSERGKALATLTNFQLSGQHHILNSQQSREIRDLFDINGIPFYLLIDKNGNILEKGSHLRPRDARLKIESLL